MSYSRRKQRRQRTCNHSGGSCPFQKSGGGNCPFQSGGDSWQWVQDRVGGLGQQQMGDDGAIKTSAPMSGGRRRTRRTRRHRKRRGTRKH